jgi:hypothetical protein
LRSLNSTRVTARLCAVAISALEDDFVIEGAAELTVAPQFAQPSSFWWPQVHRAGRVNLGVRLLTIARVEKKGCPRNAA